MRRVNVRTALFAASVFFFSLNVFSVRATFAAYFLMCALAFCSSPTLLRRQRSAVTAFFYFFICIFCTFIFSAFGDFYTNFFIKFILIQVYVTSIYVLFKNGILTQNSIQRACQTLVLVHSAFFLVQLFYFIAFGNFIDFDVYVRETSSEALYMTKALTDSLIPIRGVGLYSEPSFYAMTVVPAGAILLLINKRITGTVVIAFSTALLSMSIAAIIVCATIVVIHFFIGRSSLTAKIITISIAILSYPALYGVYDKRINQAVDYDATGSRTLVLTELRSRDTVSALVGTGLFWDERNNVGKTHLHGYQVRDSSFYIYLIFGSGIIGFLLFFGILIIVFFEKSRRCYLAYLLPLLFFKYHALYGMLWISLALFVLLAQDSLSRHRSLA